MRFRQPLVTMALLGLLAGCADFTRGQPSGNLPEQPPGNGEKFPEDGVTYTESIHSLMVNGCLSCHSASGSASSSDLVFTGDVDDDFVEALRFINENNPAQSRLLSKGAGQGHGGGAIYAAGSAEYSLLLSWISEGALP